MKILLLGATGRTGKLVLSQALHGGHEVVCLSRNSQRLEKQDGLTIIEGDPAVKSDLEKALVGCEAVISVLNISRTSDFPWAPLRTPKTYLSDVMGLLIPLAENQNINRLVVCSAWGVAETEGDMPVWFKWFVKNSNIGLAYRDHTRQEKLITSSSVDWTIIRPVGLTNSKKGKAIKETFGNEPEPSLLISRKSLSQFMVEALRRTDLIGEKVVISNA